MTQNNSKIQTISGTFGKDVSGDIRTATVIAMQGKSISSTTPTNNQILKWSGSQWVPNNPIIVSSTGPVEYNVSAGFYSGAAVASSDAIINGYPGQTLPSPAEIGRVIYFKNGGGEYICYDGINWARIYL